MSRLLSQINVCREDQPATAQRPCKGTPLDSALEDATIRVEWALTTRGKVILRTMRRCLMNALPPL